MHAQFLRKVYHWILLLKAPVILKLGQGHQELYQCVDVNMWYNHGKLRVPCDLL